MYCNATDKLTIDHIIPQSLAKTLGIDTLKNHITNVTGVET